MGVRDLLDRVVRLPGLLGLWTLMKAGISALVSRGFLIAWTWPLTAFDWQTKRRFDPGASDAGEFDSNTRSFFLVIGVWASTFVLGSSIPG